MEILKEICKVAQIEPRLTRVEFNFSIQSINSDNVADNAGLDVSYVAI